MKITQEEVIDRQTVLHIELEDEDLDTYVAQGYKKVAPSIAIPGFRKGKAPRSIVQQFIGREALLNEVLDTMLPEVTGQAIDEQEIEAVGMPSIELLDMEPFTFKATVPLSPDIDLGNYREIRLEKEAEEVKEEDVNERLEQMQHTQATWEPLEDRPVALGDAVTMTVTGSLEGEDILNEEDTEYFLDEDGNRPFPGFAESLVDMKLEETKEFSLTIPEDFSDANMAGKEVQFSVSISEAKERKLPELDDEFAKGVGDGFDSLEALREDTENELREQLETSSTQKHRDDAVNAFLEGVTVDIAPVLVGHEVDHMEGEQLRMLSQFKIRPDDYFQSQGKTRDDVRDEMKEEAEQRIKRTFALTEIAEKEGIEVSEEEVEDRIQSLLARDSEQADDEADSEPPEITDEMRDTVERMLRAEKTIDRLVAIVDGEEPPLPEAKDDEAAEEESDDNQSEEENQEEDKEKEEGD